MDTDSDKVGRASLDKQYYYFINPWQFSGHELEKKWT